MAPLTDAEAPWQPSKRCAAVLMLFVPPLVAGGEARLLFMRRSTRVRSHKGQIAFAGGRAEATDGSPGVTARREMFEEIGIAPSLVTTFGVLPPISALDGSYVQAVIGAADVDPTVLTLQHDEVDFVFAERWPCYAVGRSEEFRFNIFGSWRTSRLYATGAFPVWGLTAHILNLARLAG